jgi:nucleotide-binding universal stress UspA family protein
MNRPVIAATDFSHDGNAAVGYGADLAADLERPLTIMHIAPIPVPTGPTTVSGALIRRRLDRARRGVAGLVETVTRDHPGLVVTFSIAAGEPVDRLLERSHHAFTMVLGARGLGGYPALRWGSVSNRVMSRAFCPVIVVRADAAGAAPRAHGPIVAGDRPGGETAAQFAAELLRSGPSYLVTVHPDATARDVDLAAGGLPVERLAIRVVAAPPVLASAAAHVAADYGAGLVVVARDRHTWPFRFGVGSLVHDLVEALDCPLAVVDAAPADRPASPVPVAATATG